MDATQEKIFSIFSSQPSAVANDDDEIMWIFSRNVNQLPLYDHTLRHLLVNTLAITIGMPAGSNHLYTRIFSPAPLAKSGIRGPGSAYANEQV